MRKAPDQLDMLAKMALAQDRDIVRDRRAGLKFVQGRFACGECGEPIQFYVGHDSNGPKRCSEHRNVVEVGR